MKWLITLTLAVTAWAQMLPTMIDNNEGNTAFSYELVLGSSSWLTGPPPTCSFSLPYATTTAGLQSAINAIEACRTLTGVGIALDIPPGVYSSSNGIVIPQTSNSLATNFLVLRSTQYSHLPDGRIVCAHGMQDNLAGVAITDIGLDNPDCTGQNMYYELGPTWSGGTGGAATLTGITTLSSSTTTLAAITLNASPQLVPLANGYVSPGNSYVVDTGGNAETIVGVSGVNQVGLYGVFTKNHASGVAVTYDVGAFTLANGSVVHTSDYNDAQYLWIIEETGTAPTPFQTCSPVGTGTAPPPCTSTVLAPDHWLIEDMEVRTNVGNKQNLNIVSIGQLTLNETSISQLPQHIHGRKNWTPGDWTSLYTGANEISSAVLLTCVYCSWVDSQISQALRPGAESHGIVCGDASNQTKVVHNWVEGTSIGYFCGGQSSNLTILNNIGGTDTQLGRNRFTFPFPWLGMLNVPTANPNYPTGGSLVRKNPAELKNSLRVVKYGNIFENVDSSGGQSGVVESMTVRQNSVGAGTNYWETVREITDENNIFRNGCLGATFDARASYPTGGGGVVTPMKNVTVRNNLYYYANTGLFGCSTTNQAFYTLNGQGGMTWQATMVRDATGTKVTATLVCSNLSSSCPAGPPGAGLQMTEIVVGDPVSVYGCTDTSFNTGTVGMPAQYTPPSTAKGGAALAGTVSNGLTVVYANTGTANATENSLTCTVSNGQGYPMNFSLTHNTFIKDNVGPSLTTASLSTGAKYAVNGLIRDNIILGSGWKSSTTSGTLSEGFMWDKTTLTTDHMVLPTVPSLAAYTEYGNNPGYADSAGCTGAGCTPPTTFYAPTTPNCIGATSTSACVGFVGAMNTGTMPLTLADYHQFALRSDSSYYAGAARKASNGTSMGADLAAIDAAQTLNQYPGGYPDVLGLQPPPAAVPALFSGNVKESGKVQVAGQ